MKKSHLLFIVSLGALSVACQNETSVQDSEITAVQDEVVDTISAQETEEMGEEVVEEMALIEYGENENYWKSFSDYSRFESSELDTVYIGPGREIKNPFDYFSETRNNVFVIIDSDRYVNDEGLWVQGNNIIIRGEDGVSILIDQLYDNVMWVAGNNIIIDNLHMMHLMPGDSEGQNCSGRVVGFDGADNVTIMNCDLNGCGLAGLHDNLGNGTIYVEHNYIHNNSLGAYTNIDGDVWQEEIPNHETFVFNNNRIENNGFDRVYESGDDYYEEDFHGDH